MIKEFLVSDGLVLAEGPFKISDESIICSEVVYPLSVLGSWQFIKQDVVDAPVSSFHFVDGLVVPKNHTTTIFDRETWKIERAEKVAAIVVEVDGMPFDGDETSQNRMARAITALRSAATETTLWMLANNTAAQVTVDQLAAALVAAGQAQTEIWIKE